MKAIKILLLYCISCFLGVAKAQVEGKKDTLYLGSFTLVVNAKIPAKKDTTYYLLDLNKVSGNDRMITVDSEAFNKNIYKSYTINCLCLESGLNPIFTCNDGMKTFVGEDFIYKIHIIDLHTLIQKAKNEGFNNFNKTQALFFLNPTNKGYFKYKAFLQGKPPGPSIDIITLPAPKQ